MQWKDLYIHQMHHMVLNVSDMDADDIREIQEQCNYADKLQMGLSDLPYLALFPHVEVLILTGGIPTPEGFTALYAHSEIKILVLDYEETDTGEDGIDLSKFLTLTYVLSRSDLNIRPVSGAQERSPEIDILNEYGGGKRKVRYAPDHDIFRPSRPVFFSVEAQSPAGRLLMDILIPLEHRLCANAEVLPYSDRIRQIAMILVCMGDQMLQGGFGKERVLVRLVDGTADIRLRVDYDQFVTADRKTRLSLCVDCLARSADALYSKDPTFRHDRFLEDLCAAAGRL